MSDTSRVTATPSASVASAPSRVTSEGRAAASERIDGTSGATFVGINDPWRRAYDDGAGQGGFNQYPSRRDSGGAMFTPLVGRAASAYPANESNPDGNRPAPPIFVTDLQRGVGIYEFNMKVIAGGFKSQGSVVNRYS